MSKWLKAALVVCLAFSLAACGGQSAGGDAAGEKQSSSETITLKYAFFAAEQTYPAVVAKKWAEALEQRTGGKVKVEFYFGGTLLDASNMLDGVQKNVADVGLTALSYEPGRFPLLEISDLPFGYPNATVGSQVVSDLVREFPPEALKDYKIVKVFTTEPLYIQSKDPIASLEDLKGQQLRIAGALTPLMEALGAAPVGMSQAELAQALQTGIVSGYVSERAMLKDMRFAEMVGYYTDYPLGLVTLTAVMNQNVWNSLPEDVQKVIDELYLEMPKTAGEYMDSYVQEALEWSEKEYGLQTVTLSDEESKRWEEKIKPVIEQSVQRAEEKGLPGARYRDRIIELIEKYSAR
jgi:TRAP-type C4-dicarboxylate transport system substrate-binding protein